MDRGCHRDSLLPRVASKQPDTKAPADSASGARLQSLEGSFPAFDISATPPMFERVILTMAADG